MTPTRLRGLLVLVLLAASCGGAPAPPTPPGSADGPLPGASDPPAASSSITASVAPPSLGPDQARPPVAVLAAEGGDPVTGQLGTYTWGDGGSDSPWLRGAPISVGVGEPLAVSFDPPVGVQRWTAILVPAHAGGPSGGVPLGAGSGQPRILAPSPGRSTLAIEIVFVEGQGTANYAWLLDVR